MESGQPEKTAGKPEIPYENFAALDLRMARVISAERHPNADKLLVLRIDLGEAGERQIVAGIAQHYVPEELAGKSIVVVANLKPARLRGIESRGMLLACSHDGRVVLLTAMDEVAPGATVS
ncbi:MAG: methionine--tRNA ligase subunit beta [Candidatus Eisenbacteria bacterium]